LLASSTPSFFERALGERWGQPPPRWLEAMRVPGRIIWYALLGGCLGGMALLGWRSAGWLFLVLFVLYYGAALLTIPYKVRFAMPLVPTMCLFAGGFLEALRGRAAALAWLALAALVASCTPAEEPAEEPSAGAPPPASPPDIVLIVIDTLRRDHLELFGYAAETAPFLTELAGGAVVFERAHSTSSWTAPATASIFTGLYPNEHGLINGFRAQRNEPGELLQFAALPKDWPTLPERLAAAGYATFGIATNLNVGRKLGFARGFERFEHKRRASAEDVVATVRGWRAEIEQRRPYFLYLHFNDVHEPYDGRPEFGYLPVDDPLRDVAAYDSEIRYLDHWLEELFDVMGWADAAHTTAVTVVSDHGEEFMDHGGVGHGFTLHSEVNDVLMMLAMPGISAGIRVSEPVSLVDVVPTLLDAAGLDPLDAGSGRSLLPLSRGREQRGIERAVFAHRTRGPKDPGYTTAKPLWAVVDGPWKLLHDEGSGSTSLYDVLSDPRETHDVAGEHPEVVRRLREKLDTFRGNAVTRAGPKVEVLVDRELLSELEELGYAGQD
jgi:arylsulfatase A-like enzyme